MMNVQDEGEYEDLLSLWSDLESGLAIILGSPASIQEFEQRVWQYDRWMQALLKRDADVGLYLLFQLATNSPVGYSASHALVCAVLCHLTATEMGLNPKERDSLIHAALTMNIAMTALQDKLAEQADKPTSAQQDAIRGHAHAAVHLLTQLHVVDKIWLESVRLHHDDGQDRTALDELPPASRLARILRTVDRYAAMISPRQSRSGRSVTDSVRSIINDSRQNNDQIGHALVRAVGLCPPGSFVKLDDGSLAVVVRRSEKPNSPHVAILVNDQGQALAQPRLHRTSTSSPVIQAALPGSSVHLRINHHQVLQLANYA